MSVVRGTRQVIATVREENLPFMAASIAFYALASILPLLALSLAILSLVGAVDETVTLVQMALDGVAERAVEAGLTATRGRHVAGAVGLVIAMWSAVKVFRGLSVAFAQIYDEESELGLVDQVLRSLVVFGVILVALVLLGATSLALQMFRLPTVLPTLVGNAIAFLVLVVVALPLYYILPPVEVTLLDALPGAILAALGWIGLQVAFYYYATATDDYVTYGILGAVLLFITFLYVAAIILLLGAVVNVVGDPRSLRSTSGE